MLEHKIAYSHFFPNSNRRLEAQNILHWNMHLRMWRKRERRKRKERKRKNRKRKEKNRKEKNRKRKTKTDRKVKRTKKNTIKKAQSIHRKNLWT